MKIPNPLALIWSVIWWPLNKIALAFLGAIWFQKLTLEKMASMGVDKTTLDSLADSYNALNVRNGKPVTFGMYPVEQVKPNSDDDGGEAKP